MKTLILAALVAITAPAFAQTGYWREWNGGSPAYQTGVVVQVSSGNSAIVTPHLYSVGDNRALVVGALAFPISSITIQSVKCSNVISGTVTDCTMLARTNFYFSGGWLELWGLTAPEAGTNTIHVKFDGAADQGGAAAMMITNAHQSATFRTAVMDFRDSGAGTIPGITNTVTCASGDLIVDAIGTYPNTATYSVGTDQTARLNTGGSGASSVRTSTKPADASSEAMAWTVDVNANFSQIGVAVKDRRQWMGHGE